MKYKPVSAWKVRDKEVIEKFAKDYLEFMKKAKTERLTISIFEDMLKEKGFIPLDEFTGDSKDMAVYHINSGKALFALRVIDDLRSGMNLVVAHIDSPRLDLKPRPLIEDEEIALFKTHYYGGIKKYHWLNIPLAIHGVVYTSEGKKVEIHLGEDPDDPVFAIPDLLPHLDRKDKSVKEKFQAEKLNPIVGTVPSDEEKEAVKMNVLRILNEKYGITEEDLISAELELVPAMFPREVGIDRSLIGAYGHDDRVCSFAGIKALLSVENPSKSFGVILFDKEEIGSEGNTSAKSRFYLRVLRKILKMQGISDVEYALDEVLEKTSVISGDVCAGVNPPYKEVHDINNAPRLGYGVVLVKYTGSGGKYGSNDAHAEFVGKIRRILKESGVVWQVGLLGKVDEGGGGTVAKFLADKGAQVVDMGPALLGMHSPFELVSKADLYETYLAYKNLLEKM